MLAHPFHRHHVLADFSGRERYACKGRWALTSVERVRKKSKNVRTYLSCRWANVSRSMVLPDRWALESRRSTAGSPCPALFRATTPRCTSPRIFDSSYGPHLRTHAIRQREIGSHWTERRPANVWFFSVGYVVSCRNSWQSVSCLALRDGWKSPIFYAGHKPLIEVGFHTKCRRFYLVVSSY